MAEHYDVIVVGGGPGGYTAALYCVRAGLSTLVLERMTPGGQMAKSLLAARVDGYYCANSALMNTTRRNLTKYAVPRLSCSLKAGLWKGSTGYRLV